jgi:hypothetical protein
LQGYLLCILKAANFDEKQVLDSVHAKVNGVQVSSNVSGELGLSLPLGQETSFPALFDLFDAQKAAWGIQTYSLSMSTLEEVFLRLAEHEKDATAHGEKENNGPEAPAESLSAPGGASPTDVALPVVGGEGDVWSELESFECKKSGRRQVLAVLMAVFTAARRNPITFFLIVWNPVLLMVIVSLVIPLVTAKPPAPQAMLPSMLSNSSILVAVQTSAGLTGEISEQVKSQTLGVLGKAFEEKMVMYKDSEALAEAMLKATNSDDAVWAGKPPPSLSALFEIDPLSGSGSVTLGYNKKHFRRCRIYVIFHEM